MGDRSNGLHGPAPAPRGRAPRGRLAGEKAWAVPRSRLCGFKLELR